MESTVEFKVYGRTALFTDPLLKVGGEKCSYHIPTYEALKGITRSVYWKPTFDWVIDKVRVMKPIRTRTKGVKPLKYSGGNDLAIYTYLADVEYQVSAHFEWAVYREDLAGDRDWKKHLAVAKRMVERGGRRDIFLGTRECQGYVEPCAFDEGKGPYDEAGEVSYGLMFHGFSYPCDLGEDKLVTRLWRPKMIDGVIEFPRPEDPSLIRRDPTMLMMAPPPPPSVGLNEESIAAILKEEGL